MLINAEVKELAADIYNGIAQTVVPRKIREAVGAFTVANLNDSDYDGIKDSIDPDVSPRAGAPAGYEGGEVDLVKIEIPKPTAGMNANEKVKIQVAGAGVKLWKTATKGAGQEIVLANGVVEYGLADFPANGPLTIWAELTVPSGGVADVKFTVSYDKADTILSATGIWAEAVDFATVTPAVWSKEISKTMKDHINTNTAMQLGKHDNLIVVPAVPAVPNTSDAEPALVRTVNAGLMRFKMLVADLFTIAPATVKIDFTRTIESKLKTKTGAAWNPTEIKNPWAWPTDATKRWLDVPNDDGDPTGFDADMAYRDNGVEKTTQFLYSYDGPGIQRAASGYAASVYREYMDQFNAWEFVRIKIGSDFENPVNDTAASVQGSRASNYFEWHTRLYVKSAGANPNKTFERTGVAGDNDIGGGHQAITV